MRHRIALNPGPRRSIIPARGGPDAHRDRILRPVKLPSPGGRSDRRDQGRFSGRGVRADRVEGRSLRGARGRPTGVLEARFEALPRLPGNTDPARRVSAGGPRRKRAQVQNANARRARTKANTSIDVAAGTERRVSAEEGGCIVFSRSPGVGWGLEAGWRGATPPEAAPTSRWIPRFFDSWGSSWEPGRPRRHRFPPGPVGAAQGWECRKPRMPLGLGRGLARTGSPSAAGGNPRPTSTVLASASAPMERRPGPAGAAGARPQERRGHPRTPAE